MNWRWIVPVLFGFAVLEFAMGVCAYSSSTWNFNHTEVLYRWDAVREVCLVFVPLFFGAIAVFVFGVTALVSWASRGDRR